MSFEVSATDRAVRYFSRKGGRAAIDFIPPIS